MFIKFLCNNDSFDALIDSLLNYTIGSKYCCYLLLKNEANLYCFIELLITICC